MKVYGRMAKRIVAASCAAFMACAFFVACAPNGNNNGDAGDDPNKNPSGNLPDQTVSVTGVTLSTADDLTEIKLGTSLQLVCNVSPANATDKTVSYVCDDTAKATVDGYGLVTARALGDFTVTVTSTDGGKTDSINLSVVSNYDYEPHIFTTAPKICINTPDGSNEWTNLGVNDGSYLHYDWPYNLCTVSVEDPDGKYNLTDISAQVKIRGNYTSLYEKRPFRIKFDKKQSMLGLNGGAKCKSWVLLANYKDSSMQRNSVAYYLGQKILSSDGYYTTDFCDVELYLNGEFFGAYLLCEQQQVNKNRIDIDEPAENYASTDIGYFVEFDGYYMHEPELEQFTIDPKYNGGRPGYAIKSDIYSEAQNLFIKNFVQNLNELMVQAKNGNYLKFNDDYSGLVPAETTNALDTLSAVIDIQSLIDTYIHAEIVCDMDISNSSFFFDVDFSAGGDKKVRFEAPWDFDSALGLTNTMVNPIGMYASKSNNHYLAMFAEEDWFMEMVEAKWNEMSSLGVWQEVLDYANGLQAAYGDTLYAKNFTRWNINTNDNNGSAAAAASKGQPSAQKYLFNWLETRLAYLETVWGSGEDELKPEAGARAYRFEADDYSYSKGLKYTTGNGSSKGAYLTASRGAGETITLTVNAGSATRALFAFGIGKPQSSVVLSGWFSLSVNGQSVKMPVKFIESTASSTPDWTLVYGAEIELGEGVNTIVVTVLKDDTIHIDYFDIFSVVRLS